MPACDALPPVPESVHIVHRLGTRPAPRPFPLEITLVVSTTYLDARRAMGTFPTFLDGRPASYRSGTMHVWFFERWLSHERRSEDLKACLLDFDEHVGEGRCPVQCLMNEPVYGYLVVDEELGELHESTDFARFQKAIRAARREVSAGHEIRHSAHRSAPPAFDLSRVSAPVTVGARRSRR